MPYPWECIDCNYLNLNDKKYGKNYCEFLHYYVPPHGPSCNHPSNKNNLSSCYLTTLVCDILGYEDDCQVLTKLRTFRDTYMKTNKEYTPLLEDYDQIGPILCKYITIDENKERLASIMLNCFIKPSIDNIETNDYDKAIEIYKTMTIYLMEYYNLDTKDLNCVKQTQKVRLREVE